MMCQTNGNYMMNNFQNAQQIEPIIYMKSDENTEDSTNSTTSYMELRSMIETPSSVVANNSDKRHPNMPQL